LEAQILFNLSHPEVQNNAWTIDPTLYKEDKGDGRFNAQDWDDVPKVKYSTSLFRKMEPPKMARVVSDPSEFQLETYGAPMPESELVRKKALAKRLVKGGPDQVETPGASNASTDLVTDADQSQDPLAAEIPDSAMARAIAEFMSPKQPSSDARSLDEDDLLEEGLEDHAGLSATLDSTETDEGKARDPLTATLDSEAGSEDAIQGMPHLDDSEKSGLESDQFSEVASDLEPKASETAPSSAQDAQRIQELEAALADLQAKEQEWLREKAGLEASVEGLDHAVASLKEGQEAEIAALKDESEKKLSAQLQLLSEVTAKIDEFTQNSQRFYEPMKRLALHIAEQLVLAELNLSGSSIERLIQRCLDELPSHGVGVVTVELNPQDKARLEETAGEMTQHIQLRGLPSLKPGSVRVISDDTQVDDFVTNRLEAMAHSLLGQPEEWKERSPFFRQPLAQRDTEIQDVSQRHDVVIDPTLENEND